MVETSVRWTVNQIRDAMRAAGSMWFNPGEMRFFGTKVLPTVYCGPGGIYSVTSEQPPHGPRMFSVRKFTPASDTETPDIDTVGDFCSYTRKAAMKLARALATGNGVVSVVTASETFKEVSSLEQFVSDCHRHGNKDVKEDDCRALMCAAGNHHHYMEAQCNGTWPYVNYNSDDGPPLVVTRCRDVIAALALAVGAVNARFSGDPRGVTVKLIFADGYTNDFVREGYCVPVED